MSSRTLQTADAVSDLIDTVWPSSSSQPATRVRSAIALYLASSPDGRLGTFRAQLPTLVWHLRKQHSRLWLNPAHAWPTPKSLLLSPESRGVFRCATDGQRREVVQLDIAALLTAAAAAAVATVTPAPSKLLRSRTASAEPPSLALSSAAAPSDMPPQHGSSSTLANGGPASLAPGAGTSSVITAAPAPPGAVAPATAAAGGQADADARVLKRLIRAALAPDPAFDEKHVHLIRATAMWLASSPQPYFPSCVPHAALMSSAGQFLKEQHADLWFDPDSRRPGLKALLTGPMSRGVFRVEKPPGRSGDVVRLDLEALRQVAAVRNRRCVPTAEASTASCPVLSADGLGDGAVAEAEAPAASLMAPGLLTPIQPTIATAATAAAVAGEGLLREAESSQSSLAVAGPAAQQQQQQEEEETWARELDELVIAAVAAAWPGDDAVSRLRRRAALLLAAVTAVLGGDGQPYSMQLGYMGHLLKKSEEAALAEWRNRKAKLVALLDESADAADGRSPRRRPYLRVVQMAPHKVAVLDLRALLEDNAASAVLPPPAAVATTATAVAHDPRIFPPVPAPVSASQGAAGDEGAVAAAVAAAWPGDDAVSRLRRRAALLLAAVTAAGGVKGQPYSLEMGHMGNRLMQAEPTALAKWRAAAQPSKAKLAVLLDESADAADERAPRRQSYFRVVQMAPHKVAVLDLRALLKDNAAAAVLPPPAAVASASAAAAVHDPRVVQPVPVSVSSSQDMVPEPTVGQTVEESLVASAVGAAWPGGDAVSRLRRRAALLLAAVTMAAGGAVEEPYTMLMANMGDQLHRAEAAALAEWRAALAPAQGKLRTLLDEAADGGTPTAAVRRPYLRVVQGRYDAMVVLNLQTLLEEYTTAAAATAPPPPALPALAATAATAAAVPKAGPGASAPANATAAASAAGPRATEGPGDGVGGSSEAVLKAAAGAMLRAWDGTNTASRVRRFAAQALAEVKDGPTGQWSMLWARMTALLHKEMPDVVPRLVMEAPSWRRLTKKTALRATLDEPTSSSGRPGFLTVVRHVHDYAIQFDLPALLRWALERRIDVWWAWLDAIAPSPPPPTAAAAVTATPAAAKRCVLRLLAAAPPPHQLTFSQLGEQVPKLLGDARPSKNLRLLCMEDPSVFEVSLQGKSTHVVRLVHPKLLALIAALAEAEAEAGRYGGKDGGGSSRDGGAAPAGASQQPPPVAAAPSEAALTDASESTAKSAATAAPAELVPIAIPIPIPVPVLASCAPENQEEHEQQPYDNAGTAPTDADPAAAQADVVAVAAIATADVGWLLGFEHPCGCEPHAWAVAPLPCAAVQIVVDPYGTETATMVDHCRVCLQIGLVVQSYGCQPSLVTLHAPAATATAAAAVTWPEAVVYVVDCAACTALYGSDAAGVLLGCLRGLLEEPGVTKVVHGCKQLQPLEVACGGAVTNPLVDTRVLLSGIAFMLDLPTAPPPPPQRPEPAPSSAASSNPLGGHPTQLARTPDGSRLEPLYDLRDELSAVYDHVGELYDGLQGTGMWAEQPGLLESLMLRHYAGLRRERLAAATAAGGEGAAVAAAEVAEVVAALWLARPLGVGLVSEVAGSATALPELWMAMVEEAVLWAAVHAPLNAMRRLRNAAAAAAAATAPAEEAPLPQ